MRLLVDIGNTRIKWAHATGVAIDAMTALPNEGLDEQNLRQALLTHKLTPQEVYIANVAGERIATLVNQTIDNLWNIAPRYVLATQEVCGVRNGYLNPEQLGVDRWLGVIAAHQRASITCCVVSVGTAMTIDAVNSVGAHLGGMIAPGPELLMNALFKNTSDIATRARVGAVGKNIFANNTLDAVHQGSLHSLAALAERAAAQLENLVGTPSRILLTGGAAFHIAPLLRVPYELIPDLVLRGLAHVAESLAEQAVH